jgi:DNA-binding transcriptional ArsR family regulator
VDLAKELSFNLGVVSYHVKVLEDLGLVELRGTHQVRGALAHEYALADGVAAALGRLLC